MGKTVNVYEEVPVFESGKFLLRLVDKEKDVDGLLEVYSDKRALPLFNSDNCHGDNFYYDTREKMQNALDFWVDSYRHGYFVRWAVVDKACGRTVGTIELFHRDSDDHLDNCGLLRLDLHSSYETQEDIGDILSLLIPDSYDLFYCDKIATKAVRIAGERISALEAAGFEACTQKMKGNDGETLYGDYFVRFREKTENASGGEE